MATPNRLPGVRSKNVKVRNADLRFFIFSGLLALVVAWFLYLLTLSPKPSEAVFAMWIFGFSAAGLVGCLIVFKSGKFQGTSEGFWGFRVAHLVGVRGSALGGLFALWPFIGLVPAAIVSALAVVLLAYFIRRVAPTADTRSGKPRRKPK